MTKEELAAAVAEVIRRGDSGFVASIGVLPENPDTIGIETEDGEDFFLEVQTA